jgi:hypothetical protein
MTGFVIPVLEIARFSNSDERNTRGLRPAGIRRLVELGLKGKK